MKNFEYSLNLNQLKRELAMKGEQLKKLEIESSLKISKQQEELREAAIKIEKLENLLISSKQGSSAQDIIIETSQRESTGRVVVETIQEIQQECPNWKEILDQLKIQLKLKTDIIKNMQKIHYAKPEAKLVGPSKNLMNRCTQTDQVHSELLTETQIKKELKYYKTMHENQQVLKEQLRSLQIRAEALQSQSLENESLKLQLLEYSKEVERLKILHSETVDRISKKQFEINDLKLQIERVNQGESLKVAEYQNKVDKMYTELQISTANVKRMERLKESFMLEIKLLKENLKSFDYEINQMTDLKLDGLKLQRIKDLEAINQSFTEILSQKEGTDSSLSEESNLEKLKELFTKKIELYQRSVQNLFGFKMDLQSDDNFLFTSVDLSVVFKVNSDGLQVIKCFDISEIYERFVTKSGSIPALIAAITLAKFENKVS